MVLAKRKLTWVSVCAMVVFCCAPASLALYVGCNPDIHMDIPGVVANDFHIEGRIQSGERLGNWSDPPVLVLHIDGKFTKFTYSITPDHSDPDQNWFIFRADWSGAQYKYCEVLHLGLLFDVTCHNVAVDLVGWWTLNGQPIRIPGVPPPPNGGAVPIPGFEVFDMPAQGHQVYRIRNDSHLFDGAGGAKPGIDTEIVQLELISLTKDQLEKSLGSLPGAFRQLQMDGAQANLAWVPVENEKGPISERNPQGFPADSFFDIFIEVSSEVPGAGGLHPRVPTPIQPGGFLLARVRLRFINNAGEPDFRWVWHLHEAHQADLGDAPDSSNSWGPAMTAYPKGGPPGVQAKYPTVFRIGSPPYGPIHFQPKAVAYLGQAVTFEVEADLGPDADGINNLDVPKNMPDLDKADDGVAMPLALPYCQQTSFKYLVTIVPTLTATPDLYVNVWFDWNRDGDWDDTLQCGGAAAAVPAPEWAVQNQKLSGLPPGLHTITTPQFMPWHPQATGNPQPIWMRINISEQKWQPTSGVPATGGCGPPGGYRYGETEDYYFTPEVVPQCAPAADGKSCLTVPCQDGAEQCLPTKIRFDYNKRPYEYTILSCDCVGRDTCHVAVHPSGASAYCVGGCPTNQKCELFAVNNGDGTIDYECRCSDVPAPRYEFGDAPEGALAYPPLGVIGAFPTCRNVPTAGWIQHTNPVVRFGPAADLEPEGNAGNCPLFDPNSYDADECFGDGDAGLIRPAAYTIKGPLGGEKIVPCTSQAGSLGTVCSIAKWGPNIDIDVTDTLVTTTFSYVNVLIDWDQNGIWGGSSACATAAAPEHVLVDFPVPNGYSGPLSALNPPSFLIGPKAGYVWARFTITERRIGKDWTGEGVFEIGETEDYLLRVDEFVSPDLDFGDAPETSTGYPTTLANDGARHVILPGFCLGNTIDREPDGQPDANALGDDNNGIDDEDGIAFLSPLIAGLPALVEVRSTIPSPPTGIPALPAYLEGWIDFNGDNSWAEAGDQVFFNTQVPPGVSTWTINVPASATPGIKTYARFRYSTNANGHGYKGLASDGEVEDYMVSIAPAHEPGPPVEHLKWSQPPVEIDPMSKTPLFCGWDEPSFYIQPATPTAANPIPWSLVADDFRCLGTMPITSVHWWGSYDRWDGPEPPGFQPIGWRIAFWSNIPAMPNGFSHPGKPLWEIHIPALRIQQGRVAIDQFPQKPSETCFDYYVQLKPEEYFWQPRLVDSVTADSTFWVSITAVYPNAIPISFHPWGWKTRPWHWMDDAVRFQAKSPVLPDLSNEIGIEELTGSYCGQRTSFDMAFELDTDPNYIKWEQPYTGLRNWPHYEDEKSMAVETTVVTPEVKHAQMPDLTETGVDVDATMDYAGGTWKPQILADDFPCDQTGPLTDITIWGSWYHDVLPGMPPADGSAVTFTLSIYSDIPAKGSPTGYSMPGELLWRREFQPGQFSVKAYARDLKEGYFVPCSSPPYYEYPGDSICWQYDFHIDPAAAFRQTGTTAARKVYWLAVEARPSVPNANPDRPVRFGWKTSLTHWNDDAVWDSGSELPRLWKELRYPDAHRYKQQSIDLAFQVGTQTETAQLDIQRQVADDWQCKGLTPVTAIVWWGSYIGYRYQACDCTQEFVPPQKPDYFLLSIWSDVPANADQPYSHPGRKLWEYKAYQYDEVLVGYDKHPEPALDLVAAGHEPVLRYSIRLPQADWFHQKEQRAIYWLSIVAVYKQGNEPRYAWGWTNHKHAFNDDAVAGYYEPAAASPLPLWVWKELFDQSGASEDMSFMLFTEPGCFPSWYSTYNDWLTLGKPACWCGKPFGSGYQCDGDADGKDSGGLTKFRVFTGDLTLLVNNWQKKISDPTLNPCADIDHKDSGTLTKFRVFTKDLSVLVTNWQKKDAQLPGDCPRPE